MKKRFNKKRRYFRKKKRYSKIARINKVMRGYDPPYKHRFYFQYPVTCASTSTYTAYAINWANNNANHASDFNVVGNLLGHTSWANYAASYREY